MLLTCTPISELPYNMITMPYALGRGALIIFAHRRGYYLEARKMFILLSEWYWISLLNVIFSDTLNASVILPKINSAFKLKFKNLMLIIKLVQPMVLILDGNLGMDVPVSRNLYYLICLRHLIRSRAFTRINRQTYFPLHARNIL